MSLLQGVSVLAIVLGVFLVARFLGHSENNARGLTFAALVVANLGLILTNRSWSRTILAMLKEPNTRPVVGGRRRHRVPGAGALRARSCGTCSTSPRCMRVDLVICLLAGGAERAVVRDSQARPRGRKPPARS